MTIRSTNEFKEILSAGQDIPHSYCDSGCFYPPIVRQTFYASYEPNGSKYAGIPQCCTCRKSNSYGQYGCPRLNRDLQIRVYWFITNDVKEAENW